MLVSVYCGAPPLSSCHHAIIMPIIIIIPAKYTGALAPNKQQPTRNSDEGRSSCEPSEPTRTGKQGSGAHFHAPAGTNTPVAGGVGSTPLSPLNPLGTSVQAAAAMAALHQVCAERAYVLVVQVCVHTTHSVQPLHIVTLKEKKQRHTLPQHPTTTQQSWAAHALALQPYATQFVQQLQLPWGGPPGAPPAVTAASYDAAAPFNTAIQALFNSAVQFSGAVPTSMQPVAVADAAAGVSQGGPPSLLQLPPFAPALGAGILNPPPPLNPLKGPHVPEALDVPMAAVDKQQGKGVCFFGACCCCGCLLLLCVCVVSPPPCFCSPHAPHNTQMGKALPPPPQPTMGRAPPTSSIQLQHQNTPTAVVGVAAVGFNHIATHPLSTHHRVQMAAAMVAMVERLQHHRRSCHDASARWQHAVVGRQGPLPSVLLGAPRRGRWRDDGLRGDGM